MESSVWTFGIFILSFLSFLLVGFRAMMRPTERRLGSLEKGQASLEKGQASMERRLDSLEQGQTSLEQGQASLEQRLGALEKGQASLGAKMDKLLSRGLPSAGK